jgi:hypothetical protein
MRGRPDARGWVVRRQLNIASCSTKVLSEARQQPSFLEKSMGLYVHSLGELPTSAERGYYIYLLDYGWDEPLGEALRNNLPRMADIASRSNAVVIHGPRGVHFEDEVLSWHHVNREPAEDILPALLITTRHPSTIREAYGPAKGEKVTSNAMLIISLKKTCRSPQDGADLIQKVFSDIKGKKPLVEFQVAREMRRGVGQSLVDALVLEPTIVGCGVDVKKALAVLFGKWKSS